MSDSARDVVICAATIVVDETFATLGIVVWLALGSNYIYAEPALFSSSVEIISPSGK